MPDPMPDPMPPSGPDPGLLPIVVGTDGSPPSDRAVAWAAAEAALRRRPLRIVHVVERRSCDLPLFPPPGSRESLSARGLRLLADAKGLAREHGPEIEVTTDLAQESAAHAFCEISRRAYEVVLGHRGHGGFTSLLLGSTGLRVAGCASGPVVIVRGESLAVRGEVVVGLDLSDGSAAALEYAFDAAAVRSARLRVLHAWRLSAPLLASEYAFDVSEMEQDARWSLVEALAPWRKRHPDVEIAEDLVRDHPVAALVDASARAGLVVVGTRGRVGLGSFRLGSVGHGVIHHAHAPVAVVRPRD